MWKLVVPLWGLRFIGQGLEAILTSSTWLAAPICEAFARLAMVRPEIVSKVMEPRSCERYGPEPSIYNGRSVKAAVEVSAASIKVNALDSKLCLLQTAAPNGDGPVSSAMWAKLDWYMGATTRNDAKLHGWRVKCTSEAMQYAPPIM